MIDRKSLFKPETVADVKAHGMEREYIATLLRLPYRLWFIQDFEQGGWTAGIEEFPGCVTEGDSLIDAYNMLMEAADGWLEASLDLGHVIPKPKIVADEFE